MQKSYIKIIEDPKREGDEGKNEDDDSKMEVEEKQQPLLPQVTIRRAFLTYMELIILMY